MTKEQKGDTDSGEATAATQQQKRQGKTDKTTPTMERQGGKDSWDKPGRLGNMVRDRVTEGEIPMREEAMPEGEMAKLEMDHTNKGLSNGTEWDQDLDNIRTYLETGVCPPHLTRTAFQ